MASFRCPYCADVVRGGEPVLAAHLRICKRWPEALTGFVNDIAHAHEHDIRSLQVRVAKLEELLEKGEQDGNQATT